MCSTSVSQGSVHDRVHLKSRTPQGQCPDSRNRSSDPQRSACQKPRWSDPKPQQERLHPLGDFAPKIGGTNSSSRFWTHVYMWTMMICLANAMDHPSQFETNTEVQLLARKSYNEGQPIRPREVCGFAKVTKLLSGFEDVHYKESMRVRLDLGRHELKKRGVNSIAIKLNGVVHVYKLSGGKNGYFRMNDTAKITVDFIPDEKTWPERYGAYYTIIVNNDDYKTITFDANAGVVKTGNVSGIQSGDKIRIVIDLRNEHDVNEEKPPKNLQHNDRYGNSSGLYGLYGNPGFPTRWKPKELVFERQDATIVEINTNTDTICSMIADLIETRCQSPMVRSALENALKKIQNATEA